MEKFMTKEPRSSHEAYRQVYLWNYNFDDIFGMTSDGNGQKTPIDLERLLRKMTTWLGKLYDVASESTFEAYEKQLLSYKEMKIFFAACIILHTVRFMKYLSKHHKQLWAKHRQDIIKTYDENSTLTLQFLMKKFPQKEAGFVDPEIEKLVPIVDRTQDPDMEILNKIGVRFTGENTLQQIKLMMNTLIRKSKQYISQFRKAMVNIFTLQEGETVEVLDNLVGMKFRDTMDEYSQSEIKELGMKIKGPQMLRIMIKWIEQLQKKCKGVDKYIVNRYYPFNTKKGQQRKLNYKQKDQLALRIRQKFQVVKAADKQNVKQINSILFDLFNFITIQKQNFKYIEEKEVTVGLFTYILSESVSNIVSEYLELLIDNISQASEEIDFITFNVSDLLRCKCSGDPNQIKKVYEKLARNFPIVRVKNRLKTSNNDFLVNFKFNELTCEVQLGFKTPKTQQNKKPFYLNSFSHFLYEMARSKFSALTEIVIINNHLNQTIGFFRDILKKGNKHFKNDKALQEISISLVDKEILIEGYSPIKNTFPMFCNFCWEYKGAYESFLDMFVSKSGTNVCGECYMSCLSPEQITEYLLGARLACFFEQVSLDFLKKLEDFEECYVILLFKTYNKNMNVFCKSKGIEEFCPVFPKFNGKYEFHSPQKLKAMSFFAFTIKDELKLFKEFKEVLRNYNNVTFIDESISFDLVKNNREELIFVQNSTETLILNNENTEQTKRQRFKQLKFETLVDKSWWLMENEHIDQNFFDNPRIRLSLSKVSKLEIGDNNIKDIRFLEKSNLTHLNVSNNKIIEIDFTSFNSYNLNNFNKLTHLDISRNSLTILNLSGCNFPGLQKLIANSNKLKRFEVKRAQLDALQTLRLNNNRLERIDGFNDLALGALEILSLDDNLLENTEFLKKGENLPKPIKPDNPGKLENLARLKDENLRLPSLKQLSIEYNKMTSFEGFIQADIQTLDQISFGSPDGIDLAKWHKCTLRTLKSLEIKNTYKKIEGIKHLSRFLSLKQIIIQQNQLDSLELTDLNLKSLQILNIIENKLSKIQGLKRTNLDSLKILRLTKNSLLEFSFQNIRFPQLTHLHLQNNIISKLPHIRIASLPNLRQLHLENNRLEQFNLADMIFKQLEIINLSKNMLTRVLGTRQINGLTLNSLVYLHLENNHLVTFDFPDLPNLNAIYLQNNQLELLRNLNKAELPKLTQIQLFNNKLKEFDFKDVSLPSLKALNLSNNEITNMMYFQLAKMPCLSELRVENNRLQTIDFGNLNLPRLRFVDASNNNLLEVKGLNKKTKLVQLERLILKNNTLKGFQFDRIDLPQLIQLSLQNNSISPLVSFKGSKLPNLQNIDFENNAIEHVQFNQTFLPSLVKINFKNNKIIEIHNLNKANMDKLRFMQLDNNRIIRLDIADVHLPSLESLDITNSSLKSIEGLPSAKLPHLKQINLERNRLELFNASNTSLKSLQRINLEHNVIRDINFQGADLPCLKRISLKANHIRDIKGVKKSNFPQLQVILMNKNEMSTMDFDLTNIPKMVEINLDENKIGNILFSNVDMLELKRLSLNFNFITEIDLTNMRMNNLEVFNLTNNKTLHNLKGLDKAKLNNLIDLNLEGNSLEEIPFGSSCFDKLQNLNLVRNRLQTADGLKEVSMPSLKGLKLSENNLSYINFKYFCFNTLLKLDLDDNRLQALDNLQYAKLPYLETLNLRNNQLKKIDFKNVYMYCLKNLVLADNKLLIVTGFQQSRFPNLVSLDLCNNKLKSLDLNSTLAMSQLQKLMLHNNKLEELSGVDDRLKMLNIITLGNNPLYDNPTYGWIREKYSAPNFDKEL